VISVNGSVRTCGMRRLPQSLTFSAMLIVVCGSELFAQTAQLSGRITDATSAVLRGAVVTVTQATTGTSREVASNERGFYAVPFLRPGPYIITVTVAGFKPATLDGLALSVERVERWTTLLIESDDLAIDHRVGRQLLERLHDRGISSVEIVVVSRPQAHVAIPLERDGPIPVELQLVQPLLTRRKRIGSQ